MRERHVFANQVRAQNIEQQRLAPNGQEARLQGNHAAEEAIIVDLDEDPRALLQRFGETIAALERAQNGQVDSHLRNSLAEQLLSFERLILNSINR